VQGYRMIVGSEATEHGVGPVTPPKVEARQ
jgi:hypothetical protein